MLGDLVVRYGLATDAQVVECLAIQERHGEDGVHSRLGELLVKKGYVPRDHVLQLLGS